MEPRSGYNPRGMYASGGSRGGGGGGGGGGGMYPIQPLPPLVDMPYGNGSGLGARYPGTALLTSTRVSVPSCWNIVLDRFVNRSRCRTNSSERSLDLAVRKSSRSVRQRMRTSSSMINPFPVAMQLAVAIASSPSKEHPNRSVELKPFFNRPLDSQVSGGRDRLSAFFAIASYDSRLIYIHMCTKFLTCLASIDVLFVCVFPTRLWTFYSFV